jgi:plasmid maintenance system antidote protein VapI
VHFAGSRRKLAQISGCTHGTINYYWRTGKPLSPVMAARIAKATGMKASFFMDKQQ